MNNLWIDTRLTKEEMDFLWACISEENKTDHRHVLAGNISKSETIQDKDNWFYETILKRLIEKMFYQDWGVYYKYHIDKEEPPPKFEMNKFWVNYQKQYEFNPPHSHSGLFSFVVFMKIPTHWKEQHALPISAGTSEPASSDFWFTVGGQQGMVEIVKFPLSPEDEGRMLFFPAWLSHQVFPFYGTEEERITISGNIELIQNQNPNDEVSLEAMKHSLKLLEDQIKTTEKELKIINQEKL